MSHDLMIPRRRPDPGYDLALMIREFFRMESASGLILMAMAVLAMIVANSSLAGGYHYLLNEVHFAIGFLDGEGTNLTINKSILHWINDGLMTIFFFLVGLEIKREFKEGELSSRDRALLPFIAAVGGMAVPALIFLLCTFQNPALMKGWAIPSATDIAFTLGVMALLGSRVPLPLKVLVTAIAVIDDLGAIVIIALFYSGEMFLPAVYVALASLALLLWMNRYGVVRPAAYILVGLLLWVAVLKSGVHATLAGVVVAMCIPIRDEKNPDYSPVARLEHILHPWVAFLVLPLFGFANAGVSFAGVSLATLFDPLVLGIALGLLIGKQVGIFTALHLAVRSGLCPAPTGVTWFQMYGAAVLCGIGFTMSLFIGGLAFQDALLQTELRLGVMGGSVLSALLGYVLLHRATRG